MDLRIGLFPFYDFSSFLLLISLLFSFRRRGASACVAGSGAAHLFYASAVMLLDHHLIPMAL